MQYSNRRTESRNYYPAEGMYNVTSYLVQKYRMPAVLVDKIIKQEGPQLDNIERYLARMKRNAR